MTIVVPTPHTPLPTVPDLNDSTTFDQRAYDFNTAQEPFGDQMDALADSAYQNALHSQANATSTSDDAAAVAADKLTVAGDKAAVASDKITVAADAADVAADKITVAADKDTTKGYKNSAASSAAAASAAAASVGFQDVLFINAASSPFTVTQAHSGKLIACDTSGNAIAINLPTIAGLSLPFVIGIKKTTSDANGVTITRGGTDTFDDGTTSKSLTIPAGFTLLPDVDTAPDVWAAIGFGGINAGPVTNSGLTESTATMLGRQSPGSGSIEEIPLASQAEMEAGVEIELRAMTPLGIKQAIAAQVVPTPPTAYATLLKFA